MPSGARLAALTPLPLDSVPAELAGGVVAVGNFDGMHRGHVALLEATRAEARRLGVPSLVLTFEPHPRTVFQPEAPVFRLTPLAAKARLLKALAIDGLVVAGFDRAFAALTPEAFVETVLVGQLRLAAAVVGFNFRFGKGRSGTPALLAAVGERFGFPVTVVGEVATDAAALVSSTAIREALAAGEIARANRLLGYRWFVVGVVVAGDRRGRTLGYPTANIVLEPDCRLRHGIYAVRVQRPEGAILDGVASYGRRPTFGGEAPLFEVFLLDFSGDLYGEELAVTLLDWIRPQEKFASPEALVAAMDGDVRAARAILAVAGPGNPLDQAIAATR
ncbi:MAG: bifunctional riboflavin kinase/FAD synthetase [Bauldia sp.]